MVTARCSRCFFVGKVHRNGWIYRHLLWSTPCPGSYQPPRSEY